ncbi:MAG TPA: nitroreductase family deazaflavin-dependent oxidoreductase [Acidimicrobiia bacterium]|nr:nitroreductase family deazaflavin-dependent oxidoreductase [Acidimicrobiia bacterium]
MPNIEDFNNDFAGFNAALIDEFRNNAGHVTGMFAGAPIVLITTTGAKSGKRRTTPIVYTTDGDNVVIIASKGGAPTSPDWYHNLVANPDVTVELPSETFEARARVTEDPERERLFRAQAAIMPNFAEYEKATSRKIPVVVLERVS